jgi:hypothetical protein
MAQTYTATATGIAFASNKSMLAIMNNAGSPRIIRIKRVWMLNNGVAGVTGVLTTMTLRRIISLSAGTVVNAVRHDTNSETVASITQIAISTGATIGFDTDEFVNPYRNWVWSNDEPAAGTSSNDEFQCFIPLNCQFDSATGDTDIEPIVLRGGQGISVHHSGSSAVGSCDISIEFTMAAS